MKKHLILYFLTMMLGSPLLAGPRITGNGGDLVVCRNSNQSVRSVELLDFYEARVERGLQINLDTKKSTNELLGTMFNRLGAQERFAKEAILNLYKTFSQDANFISGIELIDVPDSNHLSFPAGCKVEQVAIQAKPQFPQDVYYKISKDLWDLMDSANQAGLIFHELLYRQYLTNNESKEVNSIPVRYINSLVASDLIQSLSPLEYIEFVSNPLHMPNTEINGYIVSIETISKKNNTLLGYCGKPTQATVVKFHGHADFEVLLDQNSTHCVSTDEKNNRVSTFYDMSSDVLGQVGIYNFTVPKSSRMSVVVDPSGQIVQLRNIELHIQQGIYKLDRLNCDLLDPILSNPSELNCSIYTSNNQKLLKDLQFMNEDFSGKFKVHLKNNLFEQAQYKDSEGIFDFSFYPSGHIQSIKSQPQSLNGYFNSFLAELPGVKRRDQPISSLLVEYYDGQGRFPKRMELGMYSVPYWLKDQKFIYLEMVSDKADQFYPNGQIMRGVFRDPVAHESITTKLKDGTSVRVGPGDTMSFDEAGDLVKVSASSI